MKTINIFQICYNSETQESRDPGFFPLDNMDNLRPDWREYWPIRTYLLNNHLDEKSLYGFFSPKFNAKTGLSSNDCFEFINSQSSDVDVFSFSPYFDSSGWFQNIFFQAASHHPNCASILEEAVKIIDPSVRVADLVMHSGNTIFCNFFVATPKFWRAWLEKCELIWALAEANEIPIAKALNGLADDHDSPAAIKTFLIERIASLILAVDDQWTVRSYDPFKLPLSPARISEEMGALIQMDALKIAYVNQKRVEYLNFYRHIQSLVLKNL